jgi:hypothetical protein
MKLDPEVRGGEVDTRPVRRNVRTLSKLGLIAGGYVAAALIASAAVAVHGTLTAGASRGADGMYAFGDFLLFLGVFGFLALFPTGLAVYFVLVRRRPRGRHVA